MSCTKYLCIRSSFVNSGWKAVPNRLPCLTATIDEAFVSPTLCFNWARTSTLEELIEETIGARINTAGNKSSDEVVMWLIYNEDSNESI